MPRSSLGLMEADTCNTNSFGLASKAMDDKLHQIAESIIASETSCKIALRKSNTISSMEQGLHYKLCATRAIGSRRATCSNSAMLGEQNCARWRWYLSATADDQ